MKRIVLSLAGGLIAMQFVLAQQITPQVVATAGNYTENGGYSVSWTLGEPVVQTATNGSTTLTQGFQQPSYNVVAITNQSIEGFSVNVFPNPATDFIIIDWTANNQDMLYISLFDIAGKKITEQSYAATQDKVSMNMSQLASAQYILEIRNKDNSISKIYQIFKK
jgi:hypothetical protein